MAKHVLVAGSLHYDLVVDADRFPAADEYILGRSPRRIPGGKGGNQAVASARAGAPTRFAGRIGDDEAGRILQANLVEAGVDIALLQIGAGEITGSSLAMVNEFGDFAAVIISGANIGFDADSIDISGDTGLLVLQNELPEDANLTLARKAAGRGIGIVLNGCPFRETSDELLALTGTLILGAGEAEAMVGQSFSNTRNALEAVESLCEHVPRVALFLGGGGMVQGERGHRPEYHPARERKPVSMHGALDFFVGAYASQIAGGSEFEAATHYAQAAATLFMTTPVERRDLIRATQIRARLGEDDQ